MDNVKRSYTKDPGIVFRKIGSEIVLVPIRNDVGDLDCVYTLNEIGALIWEHLDGVRTVDNIKSIIIEEFEVDAERAEKDVDLFLAQLEKVGTVH